VDTGQCSSRERFAADTAAPPKLHIDSVDRREGDVAGSDVAEMWVEVTVENRAGLMDRGWRPTRLGDREPGFEQLAHRRPEADRAGRTDAGDHQFEFEFEFAFRVLARSATGRGAVDATPSVRVRSDKDSQLPRAGTSLTYRALHRTMLIGAKRSVGIGVGAVGSRNARTPSQTTSDQGFVGADDEIRTRDPHLGKVKRTLR
jgi:hypothetical protein